MKALIRSWPNSSLRRRSSADGTSWIVSSSNTIAIVPASTRVLSLTKISPTNSNPNSSSFKIGSNWLATLSAPHLFLLNPVFGGPWALSPSRRFLRHHQAARQFITFPQSRENRTSFLAPGFPHKMAFKTRPAPSLHGSWRRWSWLHWTTPRRDSGPAVQTSRVCWPGRG
jgi:hypothetical protein